MARRTRARSAAAPPRRRRPAGPSPEAVVPGSLPARPISSDSAGLVPHAHAVCRQCGRIADVELSHEELALLQNLATQRPADWTVDHITFSLTGTCARCRDIPAR